MDVILSNHMISLSAQRYIAKVENSDYLYSFTSNSICFLEIDCIAQHNNEGV